MSGEVYDIYMSFLGFGVKLYTVNGDKVARTLKGKTWYLIEEQIESKYGMFDG